MNEPMTPSGPVGPMTPTTPPPPPGGLRPLGLRGGLRRLSTGLLVYGTVGLVLALVGLAALVWVGGRMGGLADRVETQVDTLALTLEDTGRVLTDAGATAGSFGVTLETSAATLDRAAASVAAIQPDLAALEAQFRGISILGNQPLANAANVIGEINTSLEGLDTQLAAIATSLQDNQAKLEANARSLSALGSRMTILARDLRSGVIDDSLDDIRSIVTVALLVLTLWTAVPAVGALVLGVWLRRQLSPGRA
jgi:hypothetical protein